MNIFDFITVDSSQLRALIEGKNPWDIANDMEALTLSLQENLNEDYEAVNGVAIHKTAEVHSTAIIKGAAFIGPNCFLAPHAYLRAGVILSENVTVGHSCEIKSSLILSGTAVAHLNYVGNSIVGQNVNIEGGAVIANHFNERRDKMIAVTIDDQIMKTGVEKFGALIGDESRIGANAVTSPGTILPKRSIVNRLQLIDQNPL